MKKLKQISKIKREDGLPFTPSTFYKLHHLKRYPGLFVKLGGSLFIDLEELNKIIEAGRQD